MPRFPACRSAVPQAESQLRVAENPGYLLATKAFFGTDLDGQIALALARTPHQKQFGGNQLLKLCVFGFGLVENGDVWVSVFPED